MFFSASGAGVARPRKFRETNRSIPLDFSGRGILSTIAARLLAAEREASPRPDRDRPGRLAAAATAALPRPSVWPRRGELR
ncbi:hypothetical protein BRAS3809_2730001 [Bradyrhizobium sp. STM 3809]|nr:hypothetical protein BRAS3809_2730001 [Bradyrhizobium sp. STM 3809]